MFDSVRNNKKIVQIFLALITLPFAFFGVDSYIRNSGAGSDLASVGGSKITSQQFESALRERQDQLRQSLGDTFKQEMMNTPEVRASVLNSLVDQRLLLIEADKNRLMAGDAQLRAAISAIPALQDNGKFSMERYEAALRSRGYSQAQFEAKLRQDLTLQQLTAPLGDAAFVSTTQAEALLRMQLEERQFSEYRIPVGRFAEKVKVDAAAVRKYYEENRLEFEVPEKVRAEYLVLSREALQAQIQVSEKEVNEWYENHKDRYLLPEERRASHILIVAQSDSASDKAVAKAKAEDVLQEVRNVPSKFADLAKKYSQDPGSAKNGGDLGFFGRGAMVKVFEDAAFRQKVGEISDVIESEFGYHIVKVVSVRPEKLRPLSEVRGEIEAEVKAQTASRKFAEAAESFSNMVYEQSDSLQSAAEKFRLKIQQSSWMTRQADTKNSVDLGPLANEKLRTMLFSEDSIKYKRNTDAVEIAPNTLVSARVLEHVPASLKPFESVSADIERKLKAREASALALKEGEAQLAKLQKGEGDHLDWSPVRKVTRLQGRGMPVASMKAIFKADTKKLPVYAGAAADEGFTLYKVTKVDSPEKIDPVALKAIRAELARIVANEEMSAYFTSLRNRYKVEVNTSLLQDRDR